MRNPIFDVAVVGSGPAGSIAALVLARAGVRVALVDKATFARDKACGDVVGPRGVALLADLSLDPGPARELSTMYLVGPTGSRVLLPARAGRTYPGYGIAVPRVRFDSWLRDRALDCGAEAITGRVAHVVGSDRGHQDLVLDDGRCIRAEHVVGADGATSTVAASTGLADSRSVLWGFAQRCYVAQTVDRPNIVLWNDPIRQWFPGYGWLFPGEDGAANVGLGVGLGHNRAGASRAVARFDAFCTHLRSIGLLTAPVGGQRLGGWLKMGMVGTRPAAGRVLLVGDSAGLVNPLQGEGIAPAMVSARVAAQCIIDDPARADDAYLRAMRDGPARFAIVAAPAHGAAVAASPQRASILARAVTNPNVGKAISAPWSLYWNDLLDGAPRGITTTTANVAHRLARVVTTHSRTGRELTSELGAPSPRGTTRSKISPVGTRMLRRYLNGMRNALESTSESLSDEEVRRPRRSGSA